MVFLWFGGFFFSDFFWDFVYKEYCCSIFQPGEKNTMQSLWFTLWQQAFQWPFVSWQGTTLSFTGPAEFHNALHQITYKRSNKDPGNLEVIKPSLFNLLYPTTSLEGHKNIIAVVFCLRTSIKLKSYKNITLNCKRVTQLPWQREQQSDLLQVVFLEVGNRSRLSLYLVLTLNWACCQVKKPPVTKEVADYSVVDCWWLFHKHCTAESGFLHSSSSFKVTAW